MLLEWTHCASRRLPGGGAIDPRPQLVFSIARVSGESARSDSCPPRYYDAMSTKMAEQILSLRLVEAVEKHPCLYNFNLPEYSRKDITEKAWVDVGEEVNLQANECKEKWRNLRSVFARHLKPVPSGSSAKSMRPYYLSDALQFAVPFIRPTNHNTPGNIRLVRKEKKHKMDSDQEDNADYSMASCSSARSGSDPLIQTSPRSSPRTIQSSPSPSVQLSLSPPSSPPPSPFHYQPKNQIKRSQEANNPNNDYSSEYLMVKKKRPAEFESLQGGANRMFLLSVLPDMNLMSLDQVRTFKRMVLESIIEILGNSDDNTENKYMKSEN